MKKPSVNRELKFSKLFSHLKNDIRYKFTNFFSKFIAIINNYSSKINNYGNRA